LGNPATCPACAKTYILEPKKTKVVVRACTGQSDRSSRAAQGVVCSRASRPFLAACGFCGHEVHVPGSALGTPAWCPQCAAFFTLVPKVGVTETAPSVAATLPSAAIPTGDASTEAVNLGNPGKLNRAFP